MNNFRDWTKAKRDLSSKGEHKKSKINHISWGKPQPGFIKLNFDGSRKLNGESHTLGSS